ncbi:MarR family winged helix-turn-helix transcriptional regulator [Fulvivirga sediminis]|uniref:MarR family transcriptional regulator n=1 Tax=Fulvivirga sediminis TaxID=2803949 RepID=A0A937F4R8_9BACT|nr:MarR family transcriptional regulator [Fulvivirga sediminis]MBL3656372.1 MarR family transcriptional regulator [Fulvivirga sediminis]
MNKSDEYSSSEQLWLENQICFPLYAVSRMVTKLYTPLLADLDITYPQYLVLLVLWKEDHLSVNEISSLLYLESNTLTPLLKRMEQKNLVRRRRSQLDERKVIVSLTPDGKGLQEKAACVPQSIVNQMSTDEVSLQEVQSFKQTLTKLMHLLNENNNRNRDELTD